MECSVEGCEGRFESSAAGGCGEGVCVEWVESGLAERSFGLARALSASWTVQLSRGFDMAALDFPSTLMLLACWDTSRPFLLEVVTGSVPRYFAIVSKLNLYTYRFPCTLCMIFLS